jgi:hypothetical protein
LTHFPRLSSFQRRLTFPLTFSSFITSPFPTSYPNNHGRSIQPTLTLLTTPQPLKHKHQPSNPCALDIPPAPQRSGRPPRDPSRLVHRRPLRPYDALNPLPVLLSSISSKPKEPISPKEQIEYPSPAIPTTSVSAYNTGWDETT